MTKDHVLRTQAYVLWRLSESFDVPELRQDLRTMAAFCAELADNSLREQEVQQTKELAA